MTVQPTVDAIRWHWDAACAAADPEMFFPTHRVPKVRRELVQLAIAVCAGCPVRRACAADALRRKAAHGVVAGVDLGDGCAHAQTEEGAQLLRAIAEGEA